jgi:DNA invertase Pin-like site-specific DNA recombinase
LKIGYARVSSTGQSLDVQLEALGQRCDKIYQEKASGSSTDGRPELEHALDQLRAGDELIVTRLDRLARSVPDLYAIVERIDRAGAAFHCLQQSIETGTATGKLILGVLGAVAQFERELTRERQAEGIARAKANGVYRKKRGRKDAVDREAVLRAYAELGSYGKAAKAVGCGKATVERIVKNKPSSGRSYGVKIGAVDLLADPQLADEPLGVGEGELHLPDDYLAKRPKATVERIVMNKPSRGRSAPCNTATEEGSTDQ